MLNPKRITRHLNILKPRRTRSSRRFRREKDNFIFLLFVSFVVENENSKDKTMPADGSSNHLTDFITGRTVPDTGSEANRQTVEQLLVESKGYAPEDIEVDAPITVGIEGETYISTVDLVVSVHGKRYMAIKCAPGSLASREREILSAARLLDDHQIPLAVASDGSTALVWDTLTGNSLGEGLDAIPSKPEAEKSFDPASVVPLDESRRHKSALIFRSYDQMNINR